MPSPYETFADCVEIEADSWTDSLPDYFGIHGRTFSYRVALQALRSRSARRFEHTTGTKSHGGLNAGLGVMLYFVHNASLAAGLQDLSLHETGRALKNPRSFDEGLGLVAREQQDVASIVERRISVHTQDNNAFDPTTLRYVIKDGFVQIPELALAIKEARFDYKNDDHELDPTKFCHAFRSLPRIYQSVVRIALKDPALVPSTRSDTEYLKLAERVLRFRA